MLLHRIQNAVVDIVILHTRAKFNLLIATEKGITTSLGGREGGRGRYKAEPIIASTKICRHTID
jgi:hypothetical protein